MSEEIIINSVRNAIHRSNEYMKERYGRDYNNKDYKHRKKLIVDWFDAKRRGDVEAMEAIDRLLGVIRD